MQILQRYLLREMTVNFFGVTAVLFAILFVNQVGVVLARAAQLQYQSGFVLELIGLGAAQNVAILLPIGLLLGIVLAFGRLYHDSEMAAAQACGVGVGRVAAAVWLLALPVTGLIVLLNFELAPRAAAAEAAMRDEAVRASVTAPLTPGNFRSFAGGRVVVYARAADRNGDLAGVFVKRSEGPIVETTVARRAHYSLSSDGQSETITLYDGQRLEGVPGSNRYRIMRFDQQLIPIRMPDSTRRGQRVDEMSTAQLLASGSPKLRAELQWRLGLPVMTLVLTVMAVPLGRLGPRQGRYAHVWIAVLIFALYANLALAARTWLERGRIPPALGLWWVHGLFLLAAIGVLAAPRVGRSWRARRGAAS
ncbi:MAG TPA: LPS export ABC transporter permease LptF [Steroidobacteraceae bacterium]